MKRLAYPLRRRDTKPTAHRDHCGAAFQAVGDEAGSCRQNQTVVRDVEPREMEMRNGRRALYRGEMPHSVTVSPKRPLTIRIVTGLQSTLRTEPTCPFDDLCLSRLQDQFGSQPSVSFRECDRRKRGI